MLKNLHVHFNVCWKNCTVKNLQVEPLLIPRDGASSDLLLIELLALTYVSSFLWFAQCLCLWICPLKVRAGDLEFVRALPLSQWNKTKHKQKCKNSNLKSFPSENIVPTFNRFDLTLGSSNQEIYGCPISSQTSNAQRFGGIGKNRPWWHQNRSSTKGKNKSFIWL